MSILRQRVAIIDAPSNLGLKPPAPGRVPGVFRLPQALRAAGLVSGLNAIEGGLVVPPPYGPTVDPTTGIRNCDAIRDFSIKLARAVKMLVQSGCFPLVLGGDCSILIGNMLALKQLGHYGVFFADGQVDFRYPENSPTGGAAGMDLALVCGRGPDVLTDIDGNKPLVQDRDVVVFGYRDVMDPSTVWPDIFNSPIRLYSLDRLRNVGLREAAIEAVIKLKENDVAGFWIHLDADVLDDEIMPAVDTRQSGGMRLDELSELLRTLLGSGMAVGMEITIFDPELDPDGSIARAFTNAVIAGFDG